MPDSLPVLALGLLLDALLPWPLRWSPPHPVQWIGALIAALDARLNRAAFSRRRRIVGGLLTLLLVVGVAAGAGLALERLAAALPWGWLIEAGAVAVMLAQRSLYVHVRAVAEALEQGGLAAGRAAVAHVVGRDPAQLDEAGVARAAIESCAENFSDGVVAPAFWMALLGLPGLFAYKAINTADSMIGHLSPRYAGFGRAAAWTDDLANLLPARLAALLLALAAHVRAGSALRTAWRDGGKHRSPNAGWPEAAMAGGLGLRLNGPRLYGGRLADLPWLGDGPAEATAADIRRSLRIYARACALTIALALAWWAIWR